MLSAKLKHRHTDQVQYGSRGTQLRVSSARPRTRESRVYSRVFMHSWTRTRIPRVKPREKTCALALETYPYKGVGSVWLYPTQPALLVTLKTRATKLPCSPEGQVQCVTIEVLSVGVAQLLCIVGRELLLQRAHVSVLCRLQFTLASAALPVSSRSGILYGRAPRAGGGCCVSSARVEYSSVASIHSSPRTRSSTRTRAPALASRALGTRE